jgi:hypothetical protein
MSVNQTADELKSIRKDEKIQRAEYFKQKENKQINIDLINQIYPDRKKDNTVFALGVYNIQVVIFGLLVGFFHV